MSYTIHASYIPNANYIQYKIDESITSPGTFVETELRGIRIAVRQSGGCGFVPCGCGCVCEPANQVCSCSFGVCPSLCLYALDVAGPGVLYVHNVYTCLCTPGLLGQFNFQVLLLSLVSSIALLTFASVIVKFLAFKVLPNK